MSSPNSNDLNEETEDQSQRKRTRVSSHPDEETTRPTENQQELNSTETNETKKIENEEIPKVNSAVIRRKRRRLHVEIDEMVDVVEATNDLIKTRESASQDASSSSSSATTTTTTATDEDKDDDDDEEVDDVDGEEDEEDTDDDDQTEFKPPVFPPTKNLYSTFRKREFGVFHRPFDRSTCRAFHDQMIGNRTIIQKMKISHKLDGHDGCVNALSFNRTGTLLASGSDDLQVIVWNWDLNQIALAYDTEHRSNVFQAKFVPFSNDCQIVSCARDGQVRMAQLNSDGSLKNTRKLAEHRASAHKLAINNINGTDIFSCGEDSLVFHIDLRENKPNKLLAVSNDAFPRLPLYSIELNRSDPNEFLIAGMDPYIRVYDRRFIDALTAKPLKSFCPDILQRAENRQRQLSVTCAVYNYNGSEILGSYNDEDIYLFDASHSDGADAIRHYSGHRNSNTVKSVNFYGRNSEYVISGSDCGNVFIWDKNSEQCIWFDKGDDDGTVNVLEPHPHFPIIATSGLEHDIKIWQPINDKPVDFKRMQNIMKHNSREREHELQFASVFDNDAGSVLRLIRPFVRRIARRHNLDEGRATNEDENEDNDDDDDDDNDEDDDDDENASARRARHVYSFDCAPS